MKSLLFFFIGVLVGLGYVFSGAVSLISPLLVMVVAACSSIFYLTRGYTQKDETALTKRAYGYGLLGALLGVLVPFALLVMAFAGM